MDLAVLRDDMVDSLEHDAKAVVHSENLGLALRNVPRHEFVDDDQQAYADTEHRQLGTRVLSPSTVGRLFEALDIKQSNSVLIIGAGVGYTAAVSAELTDEAQVHAVDITRDVVLEARNNLQTAGYEGVLVDCKDGKDGLPSYAPFDRILVEAAAIRPPQRLVDQLTQDGKLVIPIGTTTQTIAEVHADGTTKEHGTVKFAPLLVEGEQQGAIERNRMRREERERQQQANERRRGWEQDWIDWTDQLD
ncbi:protein-L-isoaspartate O-methyltransferase [Salinarchaeum sp. IM2453]|uniref:protein-L-isoaspartate O-methyltransferase family protein n=1 Tax=Salinarchaeum sp. IM2453 TaxID=2862870 RepID=UPI001C83A66F|nr:protein-L-isoaspartate O-methyltransferase [Salinarchaeum sp. IM2453]QZA88777.1 protein-L-isoaspartate O-methyltransferase [Salinarchaeum sp. IM2453]